MPVRSIRRKDGGARRGAVGASYIDGREPYHQREDVIATGGMDRQEFVRALEEVEEGTSQGRGGDGGHVVVELPELPGPIVDRIEVRRRACGLSARTLYKDTRR